MASPAGKSVGRPPSAFRPDQEEPGFLGNAPFAIEGVHLLEGQRLHVLSWRRDYNGERPHSSLGNATPGESAAQSEDQKAKVNGEPEAVEIGLAY
jgi:hypothetical protein